eukprot:GHVT01054470.1.p1 GENE.GHVT01054470.1~~GHVT01054470.1.p1  ORF type:complete len:196 (+),score=7.64 GHVT01054470.1:838-1425(+)
MELLANMSLGLWVQTGIAVQKQDHVWAGTDGWYSYYKVSKPCVTHQSNKNEFISVGCDSVVEGLVHVYNEFFGYFYSSLNSTPDTTTGSSPFTDTTTDSSPALLFTDPTIGSSPFNDYTPNGTTAANPVANSIRNDPLAQAFDPKLILFGVLVAVVAVGMIVAGIMTAIKLLRCRKSSDLRTVSYTSVTHGTIND